MRLLDTTTLDVVSFLADKIPPYAVLSHTWGAEHDEPTLQQLQELTAAGRRDPNAWTLHPVALKKGYVKLRAACSLALSQSYRYIWIDTCCIDKTSSAELSEAINSMYRWYESAGVCYVYLEDVDVGPGIVNPDISRCRWFTRGWTLQELVAPPNVVFYDYKWSYAGSKRDRPDFREQLSRTTGIDGRVLSGAMCVDELSVACRMAWAASRTTTRPEDLAYCLMGIFQVNMPLLYGEGGTRAFVRLQEEILRSVDDHSLFAWKYPKGDPLSRKLSGLLASSPRYFRESSHVGPSLPDVSRKSAPSSITNAGLHVQLHLRPIHANMAVQSGQYASSASGSGDHTDFVAILDCETFTVNKQDYCHGIRLVALCSEQFARIHSDELLTVLPPSADDQSAAGGLKYVYVKQKPAWVLPEIAVEKLEAKDSDVPYSLVDVHPSSRWDRASKTLRSGHSQHGNVLGGFRYMVNNPRKADETVVYLDVFVIVDQIEGQLGSWFGTCICNEVQPGQTLQQAFMDVSKADWSDITVPNKGNGMKRNTSQYGLTPSVAKARRGNRISFVLKISDSHSTDSAELDGQEVFGTGKIITTANLLRNRDEMDHLLALTRRMACEVVDDTLDLTFRQSVNLVHERPSKIRISSPSPGGPPVNARTQLSAMLEKVASLSRAVHVAGEDGGALGIFEQYFSDRLAAACIRGDEAAARELVHTKLVAVSVESKTSGRSFGADHPDLSSAFLAFRPVHWAAVFGRTAVVRLLTDAGGADPYARTVAGFTTLHLAALMGHADLLAHLLAAWSPAELADAALLRRGRLNETPAHLAAAYDTTTVPPPSLLLPDARNGLGETPLHRAAAMNNAAALAALAPPHPDVPDGYARTPLWHAAAAGAVDALTALLARGAAPDCPDVHGRTPLHAACREGRAEAVRLLLAAGADPAAATLPPRLAACHFAALAADRECLEAVVAAGASPDGREGEDGWWSTGPLHIAAANGWLEGVRLLVAMGCDPRRGCSHFVTARGHSQTDAGVNVARFAFGNAVEVAVRGGHGEVVAFLMGLEKDGTAG